MHACVGLGLPPGRHIELISTSLYRPGHEPTHEHTHRLPGAALDDLGATAYLDAILLSSEEGIEKPAREMFLRACARLGVQPSEAVHVGDELPACVACPS